MFAPLKCQGNMLSVCPVFLFQYFSLCFESLRAFFNFVFALLLAASFRVVVCGGLVMHLIILT